MQAATLWAERAQLCRNFQARAAELVADGAANEVWQCLMYQLWHPKNRLRMTAAVMSPRHFTCCHMLAV